MTAWNQYRLLENAAIDEQNVLFPKEGSGLILELSDEGIVHIWPLEPTFRNETSPAKETEENQDLENYLVDGDWSVKTPWMYFVCLDEVMAVMNRNMVPVSYRDLGSHRSIRAVRVLLNSSEA